MEGQNKIQKNKQTKWFWENLCFQDKMKKAHTHTHIFKLKIELQKGLICKLDLTFMKYIHNLYLLSVRPKDKINEIRAHHK